MKTTLKSTMAALSAAVLVTLALSGCETSRRSSGGGWHNMGTGPKDNRQMPDANMPGR